MMGPLGSGILGYVVRAVDEQTGEERAIKLFNPQQLTESSRGRFEREFQAISRVQHPNVVRVFEWGVHGDRPYFVMEVVSGVRLDEFARRERPAADAPGFDAFSRRVAQMFLQLAGALGAVHAAGVVHRDVKPENVFVAAGSPPGVKLLDFGHAKDDDERALTTSGTVLGTASYMAPEHVMGQPAGPQSDLYAIGCMLHEALIGRPPFTGTGVVATLMSHVNDPAPDPRTADPRVPDALAELCLALLRKSPDERPAGAAAVAAALLPLC